MCYHENKLANKFQEKKNKQEHSWRNLFALKLIARTYQFTKLKSKKLEQIAVYEEKNNIWGSAINNYY